jgi:hypothetical protein
MKKAIKSHISSSGLCHFKHTGRYNEVTKKSIMNYTKKLISSCDDETFASGEIVISWTTEDQDKNEPIRVCRLNLNLQRGDTAVLTLGEVEKLIKNLETVRDRLK